MSVFGGVNSFNLQDLVHRLLGDLGIHIEDHYRLFAGLVPSYLHARNIYAVLSDDRCKLPDNTGDIMMP